MKKLILALLLGTCFITSCTKEETFYVYHSNVKSYYIDVRANHWVDDPGLTYIYASFNMPEITNKVIEDGIVVAYFIDNSGRDNMLPYLLPYFDQNINDYYYENVRFDISRGEITFIIEDSDFKHANIPNLMKFKVSIVE